MSLTASFATANAFLVADPKSPTPNQPDYEVRVAIREYGQLTLNFTQAQLDALPENTLINGELGYPLADFLGERVISGTFNRFRKSPTAAPSLGFVITSIV